MEKYSCALFCDFFSSFVTLDSFWFYMIYCVFLCVKWPFFWFWPVIRSVCRVETFFWFSFTFCFALRWLFYFLYVTYLRLSVYLCCEVYDGGKGLWSRHPPRVILCGLALGSRLVCPPGVQPKVLIVFMLLELKVHRDVTPALITGKLSVCCPERSSRLSEKA